MALRAIHSPSGTAHSGSHDRWGFLIVADIPDELIKLERSAEEEREKLTALDGEVYDAQWKAWREAAVFQAAVTEYAARDDVSMSRHEVEQAVKSGSVRHPEPEG